MCCNDIITIYYNNSKITNKMSHFFSCQKRMKLNKNVEMKQNT